MNLRGILRKRAERGATAVEFAIVASLLFMVLFGTVQFGIAFNRYQGLQASGREAARLAALGQTTVDQIIARAKESVSIVDPNNLNRGGSSECPTPVTSDKGCIRIFTRASPGAAKVAVDTSSGNGGAQPCNLGTGKSVIVEVEYRMPITIPLWANAAVNATGAGEFRCEA